MAITTPSINGDMGGGGEGNEKFPSSQPLVASSAGFDREAEEAAARPLLARANLLRMRGQWDEAVAVCADALRRAPHSASAHSLLGDVYEAQNKFDEAVQWFGMACDLDPTNQADRAKLDRTLAVQQAKVRAEQKAAGVTSPAPTHKPAAEKTLEWIDRVLPPGKSESVARLIFALSGVIAVMIIGAAGFLWQTGRNTNALPVVQSLPGHGTGLPPLTSVPPVVVATPPHAIPPAATTARSTAVVSSRPPVAVVQPTRPSTQTGTTAAPASGTGAAAFSTDALPIVQRFAGLLAANAQVAPTLQLQAAQIDAAQNTVRLQVIAQAVAGETVTQTRERVLRAAVLAVRAASEANLSGVTVGTVHVGLQAAPSSGRAASVSGVGSNVPDAFVGTLPLAAARDMNVWGGSTADLLVRFTSLQWSPALGVAQLAPHIPDANEPVSLAATKTADFTGASASR